MAQRYRLSTTEKLTPGKQLMLRGNPAHYLANVLRLKVGDAVGVFSRTDGEFAARIAQTTKRDVVLDVRAQTRPPEAGTGLTVCFVPIKGGRLETIIEKATELGADVLQPVFSTRSVVDKINRERAEAIAREAAEQCERVSWPEIREPVKLLPLLGNWPAYMPLMYGDETGNSPPIAETLEMKPLYHPFQSTEVPRESPLPQRGRGLGEGASNQGTASVTAPSPNLSPLGGEEYAARPTRWAILAGPEGGFTADEFVALRKVPSAIGVSLGPRILRADTAIIALAAATLMAWGDWDQPPRTQGESCA